MRNPVLVGLIGLLSACASSSKPSFEPMGIPELVAQTRRPDYAVLKDFGKGPEAYRVAVHSPRIAPMLRERYSAGEKAELRKALAPALAFSLDARGLARAADRVGDSEDDPTNYDAVWVRDSLWVYLGLRTDPAERAAAKRLLLTLADYFASPAQVARFDAAIENPLVLNTEDGAMRAVHIRFDRKSPTFDDVKEGGRPQTWNHKQNDALGLFLDLFCRAVLDGEIAETELTAERRATVGRFARYFAAIRFEAMADAGSWEEIERVNTSSIALVVSGLERLVAARKSFPDVRIPVVNGMIERGYARIFRQLEAGGESPIYATDDPKYRKADAALLNLIYPAKLSQMRRKHFNAVLRAVAPLVGEVGVKRYLGDSYQSGNFWFNAGHTGDTSSDAAFTSRAEKFVPESEAQWFFDSWLSLATGILAKRYKDEKLAADSARYLNRALGQVTGGTPADPVRGGDGKPVPAFALPESYNVVFDRRAGERGLVPSPITPLNWAKAGLRLALSELPH